jgi:hypothetical protein
MTDDYGSEEANIIGNIMHKLRQQMSSLTTLDYINRLEEMLRCKVYSDLSYSGTLITSIEISEHDYLIALLKYQ